MQQPKRERPLSASVIELASGDVCVWIEPEAGGSLAGFSFRERAVLRPSVLAADRLEASCLPLAPYANRIRDGAFEFRGRKVALKGDCGGRPHALHGHGWLAAWSVIEVDRRRAALAYQYEPGDWPWAYLCEQTIAIGESSLRMELSVRNLDDVPMPAGLGFHPFFEASPGARLRAKVGGFWDADDELLPTMRHEGARLGDWTRGDVITRDRTIDNCFWGWDGAALLDLPAKKMRVEISASPSARLLHLYLPADPNCERGFCVEPVTHAPDAFNRSETDDMAGLKVLAPGETLSASMEMSVSAWD